MSSEQNSRFSKHSSHLVKLQFPLQQSSFSTQPSLSKLQPQVKSAQTPEQHKLSAPQSSPSGMHARHWKATQCKRESKLEQQSSSKKQKSSGSNASLHETSMGSGPPWHTLSSALTRNRLAMNCWRSTTNRYGRGLSNSGPWREPTVLESAASLAICNRRMTVPCRLQRHASMARPITSNWKSVTPRCCFQKRSRRRPRISSTTACSTAPRKMVSESTFLLRLDRV